MTITTTENARNYTPVMEHNRYGQHPVYGRDCISPQEAVNFLLYRLHARGYGPTTPMVTFQTHKPTDPQMVRSSVDAVELIPGFSEGITKSLQNSVNQLVRKPALAQDARHILIRTKTGDTIEIVPMTSDVTHGSPLFGMEEPLDSPASGIGTVESSTGNTGGTVEASEGLTVQTRHSAVTESDATDYFAVPPRVWLPSWRSMVASAAALPGGVAAEASSWANEIATGTENAQEAIVQAFARGIEGQTPDLEARKAARMIVNAAFLNARAKEFETDAEKGTLSFELRLESGLLVVGELTLDGRIEANVYDDQNTNAKVNLSEIWVKHLPNTTAAELVRCF